MIKSLTIALLVTGTSLLAETRDVYLESDDGDRTRIATLTLADDGGYQVSMEGAAFADHFLSMRPFKCLEGPDKNWCHVPYPYEIARNISSDLVDLEYDFLFLWKKKTDYGIDMWNGIYYRIEDQGDALVGTLHEMDMDLLSAPPPAGVTRLLRAQDIHPSAPEDHWLPRLVIQ